MCDAASMHDPLVRHAPFWSRAPGSVDACTNHQTHGPGQEPHSLQSATASCPPRLDGTRRRRNSGKSSTGSRCARRRQCASRVEPEATGRTSVRGPARETSAVARLHAKRQVQGTTGASGGACKAARKASRSCSSLSVSRTSGFQYTSSLLSISLRMKVPTSPAERHLPSAACMPALAPPSDGGPPQHRAVQRTRSRRRETAARSP